MILILNLYFFLEFVNLIWKCLLLNYFYKNVNQILMQSQLSIFSKYQYLKLIFILLSLLFLQVYFSILFRDYQKFFKLLKQLHFLKQYQLSVFNYITIQVKAILTFFNAFRAILSILNIFYQKQMIKPQFYFLYLLQYHFIS